MKLTNTPKIADYKKDKSANITRQNTHSGEKRNK